MAVGLMYLIDPLGQIAKTNDARRKSDLEQLQRTLEVYYNDNGKYPATTGSTVSPYYRLFPSSVLYDWGSVWTAYNTTLPKDPTSARNYVYFARSDGQSYWLYANLQAPADPQKCSGSECPSITTNVITANSCGPSPGKPCNFGVSSPNVSP
ncbi:MAG: hypothetical protein A3H50_00075 [Candidatus Levybacteria bacterium RIFCSPLOWO2_02_FULL_37_10]|nr:MAG: hypothetical protein A2860_01530 [Candidatus Levybacteria bacterium RIFCSPHIGHO2_01_FULL_37_33]OGH17624.1 MAG: hypothetical protein A3C97_02435 [Candidatus Levybacteria bacterium RIFCSPHIGHO2_02_FULL_37_11]OGH29334.1 MAG: hypothetical protein A3F30_02250 [Candidatus Levybacteria bacterium RIFCSPHIGHO2_12_FULL_37_12]OGH32456.1 MAG: hypothetical protein A2953_01705 [Candidatus Levybacteria bacterium RIFCSPLOWO2_01_FULL_36_54]OGH43262.1 MAG: hypothetical protein A3H50_00075 [Candidatus Lev